MGRGDHDHLLRPGEIRDLPGSCSAIKERTVSVEFFVDPSFKIHSNWRKRLEEAVEYSNDEMGCVVASEGKHKEAISYLERFLKMVPGDKDALRLLEKERQLGLLSP